MDAKVDDWVVTPRAGKAVEINALWYNALKLLETWVTEEQGSQAAAHLADHAARAYASFNDRFWYSEGGYLYDVVDGRDGDDPACRPNQVLSISLSSSYSGVFTVGERHECGHGTTAHSCWTQIAVSRSSGLQADLQR